ncbi:MAG: PIN domain-containing protein [Magnetococcus sp. YQC-3]
MAPLPEGLYGISIVSEIELLSFPSLRQEEEQAIHLLLEKLERLALNRAVRDQTILLRRRLGLKLPDAVIAATAISWNATLLTNDQQLQRVAELMVKGVL